MRRIRTTQIEDWLAELTHQGVSASKVIEAHGVLKAGAGPGRAGRGPSPSTRALSGGCRCQGAPAWTGPCWLRTRSKPWPPPCATPSTPPWSGCWPTEVCTSGKLSHCATVALSPRGGTLRIETSVHESPVTSRSARPRARCHHHPGHLRPSPPRPVRRPRRTPRPPHCPGPVYVGVRARGHVDDWEGPRLSPIVLSAPGRSGTTASGPLNPPRSGGGSGETYGHRFCPGTGRAARRSACGHLCLDGPARLVELGVARAQGRQSDLEPAAAAGRGASLMRCWPQPLRVPPP